MLLVSCTSAKTQRWWYLGDKIEIIMQTRKLFIAKRCLSLSMPLTCALCNNSGSCFVVRLDNVISVGGNCTTWARILCALNIMENINIILRNWNHSGLIRQNVYGSHKIDIYSLTSYHRTFRFCLMFFLFFSLPSPATVCDFDLSAVFNYDPIHHILILLVHPRWTLALSSSSCVTCQHRLLISFH